MSETLTAKRCWRVWATAVVAVAALGLWAPAPAAVADTYTEAATLMASDAAAGDQFGESVATDGDAILVGAPAGRTTGPGAAYVFDNAGNELARLTASDGQQEDLFGGSVAVDGDTIIVGAPGDDDGGTGSGSAYVFDRAGNQLVKLTAADAGAGDLFGADVAVDGDTIVVGARGDDENGVLAGAAYVFDGAGNQLAKLTASDGEQEDVFGGSVAVDGDTIMVGAVGDDGRGSSSGAVYLFDRAGNQLAKLTAADGDAGDLFGSDVEVDGDTIVIGAVNDEGDIGSRAGSAYVFDLAGNQVAKLAASDGGSPDEFGNQVAVDGDTIVVGARLQNNDVGIVAGAAYVFDRAGNELAKLTASDSKPFHRVGWSVAVGGGTILVGELEHEFGLGDGWDAGSAYVFRAAPASGCRYDPASRAVTVRVVNENSDDPSHIEIAEIDRSGDQITVNGVPCDGATVGNTDTIDVTGSSATREQVRLRPGLAALDVHVNPDPPSDGVVDSAVLFGSDGDDRIVIGSEGANVDGDDDVDVTLTNVALMTVFVGNGDDRVTGQGDDVTADRCNPGREVEGRITGGPTGIRLDLRGRPGNDHLTGGNHRGFDNLFGALGNDCLDGAEGLDRAVYSQAGGPVVVNLATGRARGADGADTLVNIENVNGSRFDDTLVGDSGDNGLLGLGGSDSLSGRPGTDVLLGGPGDDDVSGGPGNDDLLGEAGHDSLIGGPGIDRLDGGPDTDTCTPGPGDDPPPMNCEA